MKSHLSKTIFLDEKQEIARYDTLKYPQFEKLNKKQISFFWLPEEILLTRDARDFKTLLTPHEQHIALSNVKRQIVLDTTQGREPSTVFLPITSLPEVESFIVSWTFFEQIHSKSYTHIIRNLFSDPSVVFDNILNIKEISDCARDINRYYNDLELANSMLSPHSAHSISPYEHKKAIWLCLNAVNALEGIRFYASFACTWAFAETGRMEGNAKIIKFIARDENVHLAFTQQLIKILPQDDPDFAKIKEECQAEVEKIFADVLEQEKAWARYLFKDGSMVGMNETILCDYLEWLTAKRMGAVGLKMQTSITNNPIPWTQKWIAGAEVQVAPQEVELSSYIQGGIKKDVDPDAFKGFTL